MRPVRLTRAEQQTQTRGRLLAAAEEVFSRLGYGGASVDLISAEAGLSKGAIYSNFESKEAVFLELLRTYMERDMAQLEQIVQLEPAQQFEAVRQWLKTMYAESDCPLLVTELQLHARRSPEFAKEYYALQAKNTRALAKILEAYFAASSSPLPMDSIDLADTITALAHGLSLQHPLGAPGAPSEAGRLVEQLLQQLIRD